MLADWDTNTVLISDLLPRRHSEMVRQLAVILAEHGVTLATVPGTSDIWIRDAAPVQVTAKHFVQFDYSPDYLRHSHEHLITKPEIFRGLPGNASISNSTLIIDGGNIVGTRAVALVTDKIYKENRGRSREEVREELRRRLRVKRLIVIPKEPYDHVGHSDGMIRFAKEDLVVVGDYRQVDPAFAERLEKALDSQGLAWVRLPYVPEDQSRDGIASAVGNYLNFLRVGNLIVVPAYGLSADEVARQLLMELLPQCCVVTLPCRELAEEGGILNCATWTIRHSATASE